MDIKDSSVEGSGRKEESWRESFSFLREYQNNDEQDSGGNMSVKE